MKINRPRADKALQAIIDACHDVSLDSVSSVESFIQAVDEELTNICGAIEK